MDSKEIEYHVPMFFKVYKDGSIEKYRKHDYAPPSDNPITGVRSKDIVVVPENNVTVRLYLPKITQNNDQKFPLLVYFHGGAFVIESAFSTYYHSYLHSLAAETNVLIVSVEYRLAPEHKIPACYDDSWAAMKWVSQQANSEQGTEPWLKNHADFSRVFLSGDSAGANIAHNMMMRASVDEDKLGDGLKLVGMALVHPYFGNNEPDRIWSYCCPENPNTDDPRFNPAAHPSLLSKLVCSKILICTGGADFIRDRGWTYYESLKKCGWKGEVQLKETEGEEHVFHLVNPTCERAKALMKWLADFFQQSS